MPKDPNDVFKEIYEGVPRDELVIFHHDPLASDPHVTRMCNDARRYKELIAPQAKWKLSAAFEGQTWTLPIQRG